MNRLLVIAFAIIALLVGTNPNRSDLDGWLKIMLSKQAEEAAKRDPDNKGAAFTSILGGLLIPALPVERTNYLIFSLYTIRVPGEPDKESCVIAGIAGQFIPVRCDRLMRAAQPKASREKDTAQTDEDPFSKAYEAEKNGDSSQLESLTAQGDLRASQMTTATVWLTLMSSKQLCEDVDAFVAIEALTASLARVRGVTSVKSAATYSRHVQAIRSGRNLSQTPLPADSKELIETIGPIGSWLIGSNCNLVQIKIGTNEFSDSNIRELASDIRKIAESFEPTASWSSAPKWSAVGIDRIDHRIAIPFSNGFGVRSSVTARKYAIILSAETVLKPQHVAFSNEVSMGAFYCANVDRKTVMSIWTPNVRVLRNDAGVLVSNDLMPGNLTPNDVRQGRNYLEYLRRGIDPIEDRPDIRLFEDRLVSNDLRQTAILFWLNPADVSAVSAKDLPGAEGNATAACIQKIVRSPPDGLRVDVIKDGMPLLN